MTNPLEPNDLSHLSDEEFMALCPQGFHGTGDFEPLSPAAKAILDAYFTHADLLNREVSHEEMIAAALRALADQVVPDEDEPDWGACAEMRCDIELFMDHHRKRVVILAIATELEGK